MSKKEVIEKKTEEILTPIAEANGVKVYDVEYVKEGADYYLRCFIDKEGGVNINDCENVSRAMSAKLDEDDYIVDAYILEVSSPGLGRALKKDRHLNQSIGEEVDVKLYKPLEGTKDKEFTGFLKEFTDTTLTISCPISEEEDEDMIFDRKNIASIKLTLDF
ncbi:MAG: ribosome maturation factor RimP [Lachnospiraceae bacterium]|nr:ribosome maturation factor RimP [Lachnospiraceae bacterium]